MKVGFLTLEYPEVEGLVGGIATSMHNLAHSLSKDGHQVSIFVYGKENKTTYDKKVRIIIQKKVKVKKIGWILSRLLMQKKINREIKKGMIEIIETHDWCGPSAGLRIRCPVVIRCNGADSYFAKLLRKQTKKFTYFLERVALNGADSIVAVSQFTAKETREIFGLKKSVGNICNGINIENYDFISSENIDKRKILYFGTLIRKKGVIDLAIIFSEVLNKNKEVELLLVGRDSIDETTENQSTWNVVYSNLQKNIRNRVSYLGEVGYQKIKEHIAKANFCVFPSYAEALPVAWLEAMACGKPIVAYDVGWAPEVVESGKEGFLVPFGDTKKFAKAVLTLSNDMKLRNKMALAARTKVERLFNSELIKDQTIDWYQKILFENKSYA